LDTCSKQQHLLDHLSTPTTCTNLPSIITPAYCTNAKYEEISCQPIKPPYDGSETALIPFLNRLEIWRQNEGWASATYIKIEAKVMDITSQFTLIPESVILDQARRRWNSDTIADDKHTVGYETYNARLLTMVFTSSMTEDILTLT
jgi:hypothetical protein